MVTPGDEGKLRRGGGGGGDLEGFSVRYLGTVSSSGKGNNTDLESKFQTQNCLESKNEHQEFSLYQSRAWIPLLLPRACAGACWSGALELLLRFGGFGLMTRWMKV